MEWVDAIATAKENLISCRQARAQGLYTTRERQMESERERERERY
jgi:hypothetical protein